MVIEKRSILHMLDPMPHNSPFDINMAMDAGFDVMMPYNNVKLESVHGLVQDAIFSRGPSGVKKTGVFIGGRNVGLALDMMDACKKAMVPPFEISVFADPSGAFTTAAALVASVEKQLNEKHGKELKGCDTVVIGGTGAVGITTGVIASLAGADVVLTDHLSVDTAISVAKEYNSRFGCNLKGTYASSEADKAMLILNADVVFCTAKAGVQVLSKTVLGQAKQLKVAADINAVPPLGMEGIKRGDMGTPLQHAVNSSGAIGIGALAVGNIKYQLQHILLKMMVEPENPLYLDFRDAFTKAEELLSS